MSQIAYLHPGKRELAKAETSFDELVKGVRAVLRYA